MNDVPAMYDAAGIEALCDHDYWWVLFFFFRPVPVNHASAYGFPRTQISCIQVYAESLSSTKSSTAH